MPDPPTVESCHGQFNGLPSLQTHHNRANADHGQTLPQHMPFLNAPYHPGGKLKRGCGPNGGQLICAFGLTGVYSGGPATAPRRRREGAIR